MLYTLSMILSCITTTLLCNPQPDPLALLRGVKQSREAIKRGYFEATSKTWSVQHKDSAEIRQRIWVSGKNITFYGKYQALQLDGNAGNVEELLRISRDNPEALVRAGKAKYFESDTRSIWNGSELLQYRSHENTADYVQPIRGETEKMYDPRHFGMHQFFLLKQSIDGPLLLIEAPDIVYKLVGLENVEGQSAWHVQVHLPSKKQDYHYWIDNTDQFRLYKMIVGNTTTVSKFHLSDKHSIPYEVNVTEKDDQGALRITWKWYNISYTDKIEEKIDIGNITSLGLRVGCTVNDQRIKKRLGYWNGNGISEDLPVAIQTAKEDIAHVEAVKDYWRYFWILIAILLVAAGGFWVRRTYSNRLP